ncbi:hypothetical protein IFR05_005995 [Cadophora sp. M221]|nr:hypothetical protein IFR05_005995 [Cadophora sp. M221]
MERHHPPEARGAGLQTMSKVSKDYHRWGHHRSSKDRDRRAHKDPSRAEARPGHPAAKLPKESLGMALSGDNDYVRRWLAQTESDTNQCDSLVSRETSNQERNRGAHVEYPAHRTPLDLAIASGPSKRKRKHDSSSDSSLLEAPIRPLSHQWKQDGPRSVSPRQPENQQTTPRKKGKVASSDSGLSSHPATPSPPKETFEKRARHKTREDRYEPKKKDKKSGKITGEKSSRKKREKRGDRKKAARKAGDELMQNFSSKSIAQDRLTIRPSQGPGLFNNGRASSPARRRGIPDLAFSEMEFLRHARTNQHADSADKVKSRSREKEKKMGSKVQDEISSFFRPNRAPLQDISSNQGGTPSEVSRKEHSLYARQLESERNTSINKPSKPCGSYLDPGGKPQPAEPPNRYQTGHSYNPSPKISRSRNTPGSTSRVSGKATTYVSWSESQRSPPPTSLHDYFDQRPGSTTPDSVRRSIEKTGIFKDTGIERTTRLDRTNASPGTYIPRAAKTHGTRHANPSERVATEATDSSETGAEISEACVRSRDEALRESSRRDTRDEPPALSKRLASKNQTGEIDNHGTTRKRIVIERFDPTIGWREDPNAINRSQRALAMIDDDTAQQSKSTPPSREQIAKSARVKMPRRPSTTVPVLRDAAAPHDEEQDGIISILEPSNKSSMNQYSLGVSEPRIFTNSAHRPLLSRASNPSLPTIYEDSHEHSPSHGEAPGPERQVGSNTALEPSQPRLNAPWGNNQNQLENQLQQQTQANNQAVQEMNQIDAMDSSSGTYLGFPMRGTWLGNSLGGTTAGPNRLTLVAGTGSLYLRQMQTETPSHQFTSGSPRHAIDGPSCEPSGIELPAYDGGHGGHGYGDQQHAAQFAQYNHTFNHSISQLINHRYEREISNFDPENFDKLGEWNPEAHGVDQNFDDHHHMLEDQNYYHENENMFEEQAYSIPHQSAPQGVEYDGYTLEMDAHNNGFWRPHHQY